MHPLQRCNPASCPRSTSRLHPHLRWSRAGAAFERAVLQNRKFVIQYAPPNQASPSDRQIIEAWDHEATSGRDNYVRVVEPYYLFPFGHRCSLITITERKIKEPDNPQARLYQRKFITIRPSQIFEAR